MQNATDILVPQNEFMFEDMKAVDRDTATRPVVAALMTGNEYRQFVEVNLHKADWDFDVCLFEAEFYNKADLIEKLNECSTEVVITSWETPYLPENLAQLVPSLKYIAHIFGTTKPFLPRRVIEDGIIVTNWGTTAAKDVAEHCLMQTLASLRRVSECQLRLHIDKKWRPENFKVSTLFAKSVGIYGSGRCAREYANLLKMFDCRISMFSRSIPDNLHPSIKIASSLEELFADNEIIVVLEAANEDTYKSIDKKQLSLIRDNGVFINTARGSILNEDDLAEIAKQKRIQIALDVFDPEPLSADSPLRGCENVLLTPHIAGPTADNRKNCGFFCLKNIQAYFGGQDLNSIVGVQEYDRMSEN